MNRSMNKTLNNEYQACSEDRVPFTLPESKLSGAIHFFDGRSVRIVPYTDLVEDVRTLRDKLLAAGLQKDHCVGIRATNCYEWVVFDLAVVSVGSTFVCFPEEGINDTNIEELADKYDLSLLFVTSDFMKKEWKDHKWIYVINTNNSNLAVELRPTNQSGELKNRIAASDTFNLVFSSGTSGELKCLLLSKLGVQAPIDQFADQWGLKQGEGVLVALPMSIFQQRLMVYACLRTDATILMTTSAQLFRSLKVLKPSIILGPPALFETIEQRFVGISKVKKAKMKLRAALISVSFSAKSRTKRFKKLFSKQHDALGGNVRVLLTGSAPSKLTTLEFYKAIKLPIFQAYGMAEIGFISWNRADANRMMSVGKPIIPNTVSFEEDGGIIVTIDNPQCNGYFGLDSEIEKMTFLPNGSIATGDVGRLDKDGYLFITGRKKNIILLSSGIKVNPEKIEQFFENITGTLRIVAIGGDWVSGIALIVAIDPNESQQELERIKSDVETRISEYNTNKKSGEQIYSMIVTRTEFSVESGLVTRNLKTDRNAVMNFFEKEFLVNE
jgi:long-chain acyl-CoA synthetase